MTDSAIPPPITELSARADELRERLVEWCNQNSGSGNLPGLSVMLDRLRAAFGTLPGECTEVPLAGTTARALRIGVRPDAPLQVFLSGHYDTVYPADHSFQSCSRIDATTLGGPGVADMKGGLVVMLAALQAFEQTPAARQLGYEILLSPDEETGSHGTTQMLAEAARRHQFGLVFEPARVDGSLVRTRMGTGSILATCHGRAAHAAKPEDGRNAIVALAEFLVSAHRLAASFPGVLLNIGQICGGGAAINIVPDFAESKIDLRTTRPGDDALILSQLQHLAAPLNARDGYRLELKGTFNRPPKGTGAAEAAAFAGIQTAACDLGLPPIHWTDAAGGSDGNLLYAAGLANLDGLGPIGGHLHSDREMIELPSLVARAQLAALFLHRLASGQIQIPRPAPPSI